MSCVPLHISSLTTARACRLLICHAAEIRSRPSLKSAVRYLGMPMATPARCSLPARGGLLRGMSLDSRTETGVEVSTTESVVREKIVNWLDDLDPALYLVGTPIGNLEDITLRALRVLKTASAILAEDTRTTRKLMDHYQLRTPLISYHTHNERAREGEVLQRLKRGEALAVVSDAGMPGISDPGSSLVAAAVREGIPVIPIPGPSAVLTGLVGSGLPTDEFIFVGFLPPKKAARQKKLRELAGCKATVVMYVSPHSLTATLEEMVEIMGEHRKCCISRELTKMYEEFWRSSLKDAALEFTVRKPRGEVTLVIQGGDSTSAAALPAATPEDQMLKLLSDGMSVSDISKKVAKEFPSFGRRKAYNLCLSLQKKQAQMT